MRCTRANSPNGTNTPLCERTRNARIASTSAFAPKYYPKAIIDYANSRGADKVLYAGYFPMGLSLERIFSELPNVPLKDDVWPKFLYGNAARILGLEG